MRWHSIAASKAGKISAPKWNITNYKPCNSEVGEKSRSTRRKSAFSTSKAINISAAFLTTSLSTENTLAGSPSTSLKAGQPRVSFTGPWVVEKRWAFLDGWKNKSAGNTGIHHTIYTCLRTVYHYCKAPYSATTAIGGSLTSWALKPPNSSMPLWKNTV